MNTQKYLFCLLGTENNKPFFITTEDCDRFITQPEFFLLHTSETIKSTEESLDLLKQYLEKNRKEEKAPKENVDSEKSTNIVENVVLEIETPRPVFENMTLEELKETAKELGMKVAGPTGKEKLLNMVIATWTAKYRKD